MKIIIIKALFVILFCQFSFASSSQDLNAEFESFTKDPVALGARDNRYILDSIIFLNKISHPKITVDLIKKIMVQPDYCDQYSLGGCPINVNDFDCFLCVEENTNKYFELKYPTIYSNKIWGIKIQKFLNSKTKRQYYKY